MYIYIYVYICTYIYKNIYTYIHTYEYIYCILEVELVNSNIVCRGLVLCKILVFEAITCSHVNCWFRVVIVLDCPLIFFVMLRNEAVQPLQLYEYVYIYI